MTDRGPRGRADAGRGGPWAPRDRWALASLVALALASLPWLVHGYHECNVAVNDAAMYVLAAKSLVAGEGYAYLGQPFTVRPPGMSVLVAPIVAWRGVDFLWLNALVSLCGVGAVALLFALARSRLGTWTAVALCVLVWLNPALRRFSNQVMSDVPGLAALLGCLVVERWSARRPSLARELALGALVAAAAYLRTVNLLLVPAIVAARAVEKLRTEGASGGWGELARRRAAVFTLTALALVVPWMVRDARARPAPPVDQTFVHSYATGMLHADPGDPSSPRLSLGEILARVPTRGSQILSLCGSRMLTENAELAPFEPLARGAAGTYDDRIEPRRWHAIAGACLLAVALVQAGRKARASDLVLVANVAVIAIYFGFQDRLVLPIWVLAACAALELVRELVLRRVAPRAARIAVEAGLSVALLALALHDFGLRAGVEQIAARCSTVRAFCSDVEPRLAPDAVVAAPIGWHYSLFLERPVYSLMFGMRREGGAGLWKVVDARGINTLIALPDSPTGGELIARLRARFEVQPTVHDGIVVRVRP